MRLVKELIDSGVVGAAPKFGALLLQYAITLVIKHAFRQAYILIEQLIEGEHAKNEKEDKPKTADFSEAVRKYLEDSMPSYLRSLIDLLLFSVTIATFYGRYQGYLPFESFLTSDSSCFRYSSHKSKY